MSCGFAELADQHFLYIRTVTGPLLTLGGKSRFGAKGSVVVKWPQAAVAVCQMAKDRERKSR
jgi:hypothetical protein